MSTARTHRTPKTGKYDHLHPRHQAELHHFLVNLLLGIGIALLGVMWVMSILVAPVLPDSVPVHFGPDGFPDAYTTNHLWVIIGLPLLASILTLGVLLLLLYPKYANLPGSLLVDILPPRERAWMEHIIRATLVPMLTLVNLLFAYLYFGMLDVAVGNRDALNVGILAAILVLLLVTAAVYSVGSTRITQAIVRSIKRP
jgi:uncharacterized membrane protein